MPKMQTMCLDLVQQRKDVWFGREEVFTPLGCYFMSFSPLFHMYLSLQCVLMLLCRRSTLLSPPCHINCHLQASKFRGWTCLFMEKKNHRSIAFFQDYNIWGRYIYLACINVCMSGVFFRDYIASWAHDIHPLLNYSIIMFLFKKISILFFFYYFIVIHHHCSWKRVI